MNYKFRRIINVQNNQFAYGTYFVLFNLLFYSTKEIVITYWRFDVIIALIIHMQVILILMSLKSHI